MFFQGGKSVRISIKQTHTALLASLLALASSQGLQAQYGPFDLSAKMRLGLSAGDLRGYHADNKIASFGVEFKKEMFGPGSALAAELAFEYVPGRHYEVLKAQRLADLIYNVDDRKEWGQGWTVRFSYYSAMPAFGPELVANIASKMDWFAGIGIDRHNVSSEVKYSLRDTTNVVPPPPGSTNWPAITPTSPPWMPGDAFGGFTENGTGLNFSLFGGIKYRINDDMGTELTLRNFGMKHWDYTPGGYTGSDSGKLDEGSARGWSLEIALAIKL
jgi:hypothetical protein